MARRVFFLRRGAPAELGDSTTADRYAAESAAYRTEINREGSPERIGCTAHAGDLQLRDRYAPCRPGSRPHSPQPCSAVATAQLTHT